MSETAAPSLTRRASLRRTRVQYLVTADESSLAELEMLLATLPTCATGRVFIEVPDAAAMTPLSAPARMTVTWLDRSRRTGDPGTGRGCGVGQALARAVTGWADEMLCDDERASTKVTLLGGYLGTADIVDHLVERCRIDRAAIHAPERFGLSQPR